MRAIEPNIGSNLDFCVGVDNFMDFVYEPLVYMLNLWLVFITDDEVDMVLNALAMEFILKVDNQLKGDLLSYLNAGLIDTDRLNEANRAKWERYSGEDVSLRSCLGNPRWHPANYAHAPFTYFLKTCGWISNLFSPFILLGGGIAGSICKPD
eukprot:506871-Rhodomonas_salina.1